MAGPTALNTIPVILQSLSSMAEKGWEEEEDAYYSDEENLEEVAVSVAVEGLGVCGELELSKSCHRT